MAEPRPMNELTARADLKGIRLVTAEVGTSVRSPEEVGNVVVAFDNEIDVQLPEADDRLRVRLTFHVYLVPLENGEPPLEEIPEPVVWIKPAFELEYAVPEGLDVSKEVAHTFASGTGVFNAWPYLREFVQSTLSRMGLPQVTVPLLRRQPAVVEVDESPARARG